MATRHRLSPHFVIEEFDCHDGTKVAPELYPDLEHLAAWWLEPLRSEFGAVTVVSGFRTVKHNASVGGAIASVHLLKTPLPGGGQSGRSGAKKPRRPMAAAADVVPRSGNPETWARWARALRRAHGHLGKEGRGGVGLYVRQGFVHLDTGPSRDWTG